MKIIYDLSLSNKPYCNKITGPTLQKEFKSTDSLYHFLESIRNYFNIQISYQIDKYQFTDPNYMSCSKPSEPVLI